MVTSKLSRTIAATVLTGALLGGLSACGTPQTLQPYTPAEGVQVELGEKGQVPLKVRNLMVIAKGGQGFLVGAIMNPTDHSVPDGMVTRRVPNEPDALASVSGRTLKQNGTPVGEIQAVTPNIDLPPGKLVVLQNAAPVQISGPGLTPGLLVELDLVFKSGRRHTMQVPVVDGTKENYKDVKPGAAA